MWVLDDVIEFPFWSVVVRLQVFDPVSGFSIACAIENVQEGVRVIEVCCQRVWGAIVKIVDESVLLGSYDTHRVVHSDLVHVMTGENLVPT